jgi:dTDP-4-dehydrorhamnose 3,5-epimerase
MQKIETSLQGVYEIIPDVYGDDRGFFFESYNAEKFAAIGIDTVFVQDNHSFSKKGVLRGLHFQLPPSPMTKLVRCTRGRLWDVAVDLRKNSPTYLEWFGVELSAENKKMLYVPEGCAHGFYALEDCELLYKVSHTFQKELDGAVAWNDSAFNIAWPLQGDPILSDKDKVAPKLSELQLPW